MYHIHLRWLREVDKDIRILGLKKEREFLLYESMYLSYYRQKAILALSKASLQYMEAVRKHNEIDLELSLIDGRYKYIASYISKGKKKTIKKTNGSKKTIKDLSQKERRKLIEELMDMK